MGYNTEVITNIADTDLQIAHANGYYYIVRMYREDGYHEVLGDLDAGMMKQLTPYAVECNESEQANYRKRILTWEDIKIMARLGGIVLPDEAKQHEIDFIRETLRARYEEWSKKLSFVTLQTIRNLEHGGARATLLDSVEDL